MADSYIAEAGPGSGDRGYGLGRANGTWAQPRGERGSKSTLRSSLTTSGASLIARLVRLLSGSLSMYNLFKIFPPRE